MSTFGTFQDRVPIDPEAWGRERVPGIANWYGFADDPAVLAAQAAVIAGDHETAARILYENKVVCCWYCARLEGTRLSRGPHNDILCERCWKYIVLTYTAPNAWVSLNGWTFA